MKLVRFLMRLTNEVVTVETKEGSCITGTVQGVDNSMNVHLKTAKCVKKNKNPINFDQITIRGMNIRNIILPETLNLDTLLVDTTAKAKIKAAVKTTFSKTKPAKGKGPRPNK
ncbi:Small nuclear ribonucleoprotein Sm D1 [Entamoeba marina]